MRSTYRNRIRKGKQKKQPLVEWSIPTDQESIQKMLREQLGNLATELALITAAKFLEAEVTEYCGSRYQRPPNRTMTRYGHQRGAVFLSGQKVALKRPRVRYTDGGGEVELANYAAMQRPEAMPRAVLARLLRGVSCRDYEGVVETATW